MTTVALSYKQLAKEIGKEILRNIAKRALQAMTKSTLNWINSGFHGAPLFLENPQSFFKDIAKYEVKTFVDEIGYNTVGMPFGKDFALGTIYLYKQQFQENTRYSLSNITQDEGYLRSFRNDFSVGGWEGFLLNTQYPQNNPIGFSLLATDELARRVAGTEQNAAQTTSTKLQQGLGFLSPQTCPSNTRYDNLRSAFNQPTYKPSTWEGPDPIYSEGNESGQPSNQAEIDAYNNIYYVKEEVAKTAWEAENGCPGGLVDTTPGSVVGSQATNALSSPTRNNELATAMGNSISAILDTLINHFMNKGLNALATTTNPPPPVDDWDYFGNTLGTAGYSSNTSWSSGPDEVIILSEFKKDVDDGIANTIEEIGLMNDIGKMLNNIWPKVRELDQCLPGPDIGWEDRLSAEKSRNSIKFSQKSSDEDPKVAAAGRLADNELQYAVNLFKDWIQNKILLTLPNSVNYLEAVNGLESIYQKSDELTNSKRIKTQTLARLKSIQMALGSFTVEPASGSTEEKTLIALKKQYNATRDSTSNTFSIEDTRKELNIATEQYDGLVAMTSRCETERKNAGWNPADTKGRGESKGPNGNTEKEEFCSLPVVGGEPHDPFLTPFGGLKLSSGPYVPTYVNQNLPLVNAVNVEYGDERNIALSILCFGFCGGVDKADISVNCDVVYKASILDYKGSIPGVTTVTEAVSSRFGTTSTPPGLTIPPTTVATVDLGVGTFPDPVYYNGKIYVAVQQGLALNSQLNLYSFNTDLSNQQVVQIPFSGVGLAFQRLAVFNNTLWMIFRDGENSAGVIPESIRLWRSDTGAVENLGYVWGSGNDPVAIGNGYIAWQEQQAGVIKILRRSITGGAITNLGPGAPTGLSRIMPNGSVVLIDTDRLAVPWGSRAWFATSLVVAEDYTPTDNGIVGRFNNDSVTEFNLWPGQLAHTPHAAFDGSINYVVATWNPTVRVAVLVP